MNRNLSDYRVVNPLTCNFSAAEARASWSTLRFNNLTAAELGYPEHVRLLISQDGNTLAIQGCEKDDPCAVPFMCGRTADDLKGQKKWLTITNRMLLRIIREKQHWDDAKTQRRFYGVPWGEQGAILFDLTRIAPPRTRTPYYSPDDMLQTYALAAQTSFVPVVIGSSNPFPPYAPVPPTELKKKSQVIEADYSIVN